MSGIFTKNRGLDLVKRNRLEVISLILIVGLFVSLQAPMRDSWNNTFFLSDDVYNLNVANNLRNGDGFVRTAHSKIGSPGEYYHLPISIEHLPTVDRIIEIYPSLDVPISGKGPIYYSLLAFTLWITDADPESWWLIGSTLSGLISIVLIIILFLFARKYFGVNVAIVSSFMVVTTTIFVHYSTRVLHYPLFFVFLLSAFYFTNNTKKDYVLFGLFSGLAHLTHPFGVLIISSYALFLLLKKEFKGCGLVLLTWFLVVLPWFIRNVLTTGEFGHGFFIPFSGKITEIFGLDRFASVIPSAGTVGQTLGTSWQHHIQLIFSYEGLFSLEIDQTWHMVGYVIILFFAVFAFLSFSKIKIEIQKKIKIQKNKALFFKIGLIILTLFVFSTYQFWEFFLPKQLWANYNNYIYPITNIFQFFVFPIILIILLYFKRTVFEDKIPRIFQFILLFSLISIIAYFFHAQQIGRLIPELKQILPAILVATPLAVYGFEKVIKKIINNFDLKKVKFRYVPWFSLILLIIIINQATVYEFALGYTDWVGFGDFASKRAEKPSHAEMNEWLRENLDSNSMISTDYAQALWQKTGLRTTLLPKETFDIDINAMDKFIDKYNVTHFVLHYPYDTTLFNDFVTNKYFFNKIYSSENIDEYSKKFSRYYHVYYVDNYADATFDHPPIARAAKALSIKEVNPDEAYRFYNNLIESKDLDKITNQYLIANLFAHFESPQYALSFISNSVDTSHFYSDAVLKEWIPSREDAINYQKLSQLIAPAYENPEFKESRQELKEFAFYKEFLKMEPYDIDAIKGLTRIAIMAEEDDEVVISYFSYLFKVSQLKILYPSVDEKMLIPIFRDRLILEGDTSGLESQFREAKLSLGTWFENNLKFNKAERLYLGMYGDNQFDKPVIKRLAALYEKMEDKPNQALRYYNILAKFESENQQIHEKISELEQLIKKSEPS